MFLNYNFMGRCVNAAKPETTVQASVSTFVSMKPLDINNNMSGHFPVMFVATEPGKNKPDSRPQHLPSVLCV